ncbi:hypothetical protein BABINDRAFT_31452 [Babjeviella inositovora NRRL Y-12698]|uniref:t-SNARE coiled-coil homology domain-containing protein n=1 Tax=Babjeviella inositovora NRRL Y-12698 TaxID=984486 RepID=A0A1E3QZS4_9ASCO|nr:uncharacterized protein BABINDRAFT_31452 [Babjeviella inositovora NRRL Y-12698]ODQ83044.1 hypothetical protein BABINDRAFT_31452 [Babjeviella inositovora NRRL Y-12698]
MSELFQTYESEYELAHQEAEQKLSQISDLAGDKRRTAMRDVERATDECLEILDQMNLEIQNMSTNERSSYNAKLRTYKATVDKSKKQLKFLQDNTNRDELFLGRTQESSDPSSHDYQRQQLLKNNASLERSSDRLRDSQRVALETEEIGSSILNDLRGQREQLVNSRNQLIDADGYVDKSIRTLRSMTRRLAANKLISYAIIAVLVILILLVIASKFT